MVDFFLVCTDVLYISILNRLVLDFLVAHSIEISVCCFRNVLDIICFFFSSENYNLSFLFDTCEHGLIYGSF